MSKKRTKSPNRKLDSSSRMFTLESILNVARKNRSKLMVILIVLVGIWYFVLGGSSYIAKLSIQSYLEDKYGVEFVVAKPRFSAGSLGDIGQWTSEAYPSANSELKFFVFKGVGKNVYSDRYLNAVWTAEETARMDVLLEDMYGQDVSVHRLSVRSTSTGGIEGLPSMEDAIKSYGKSMSYSLSISQRMDEPGYDALVVFERNFRNLYNYLTSRGVSVVYLNVEVSVPNDSSDYVCSINSNSSDSVDVVVDRCVSELIKKGVRR